MTLEQWLKKTGTSVTELSHRSRVSMLTIRRVRDGRTLRNIDVAEKLAAATNGAVTALSLLGLETRARKAS